MPHPKPAQVADYDSDEGRIVSGTEVSAHTSRSSKHRPSSSSKPPKQGGGGAAAAVAAGAGPAAGGAGGGGGGERASRSATPHVPASDSGYSSTPAADTKPATSTATATATAAAAAANSPAKPAQSTSSPAVAPSPVKSKPIIHRQDSARSTTRAATISNTTAKRKEHCTDPNCRDPNCDSTRNLERRYTNPNREHRNSMSAALPPAQAQYHYYPQQQQQQQQQHDYAAMPPPSAMPLARRESMVHPRPHSLHMPHVSAGLPLSYPVVHPGATPGYGYGHPQASYAPQQPVVYGTAPPTQQAVYPPPPSPVKAAVPSSPLTGTYPGYPGQLGKISARTGNPAVPGLVTSIPMQPPAPAYNVSAGGGMSARADRRTKNHAAEQRRLRDDENTSSESESSSDERNQDARYDYHRDEQDRRREPKRIEYERQRSKSRRRRSVVIEDPRPVAKKSYTTSVVPTRQSSRRDSISRPDLNHRTTSDPLVEYVSSPDTYESSHPSKAVLDRRERDRRDAASAKRHSRRMSVSTTADSYDTPPTSISNGSGYVEAIIEDRGGSRRVYLSREQYAELTRRYEREDREAERDRLEAQRMHLERIERYQKEQAAGVERQNLTATNIKEAARTTTKSHVSSRSQKTTTSGSRLSRGGLTLERNGTMLYLEEGIPEISLKLDDDGHTRVVIGSGTNGREQSYHGSKSSGSRVGRPRTSRQHSIREEEQYERGL